MSDLDNASLRDDPFQSPPAINLADLDDPALVRWFRRATFASIPRRPSAPFGRQWQRARSAANSEFAKRLKKHADLTGCCDNCGGRPLFRHVATGEGSALRFTHYCKTCSPSSPGWYVMAGDGTGWLEPFWAFLRWITESIRSALLRTSP